MQPIITNARQGLETSNFNRRKRSPLAGFVLFLALFWGGVAAAILAAITR